MRKSALWLMALAAVGGCNSGLLSPLPPNPDGGDAAAAAIVNMCLPTSPASCMETCLGAGAILKQHCAQCHDAPENYGATPFDFVLDVNRLITTIWHRTNGDARFLVPGDPDNSAIYVRPVLIQDQPPARVDERGIPVPPLSPSEGSVLQYWIASCLGDDPMGQGGTGGAVGAGGTDGAFGTGGSGGTGGTDAGSTACVDAAAGETIAASCGTSYPPNGFFGANLLTPGCTSFSSAIQTYEMAVDVTDPLSLVVKWTLLSGQPWEIGQSDWRFTNWGESDAAGEQTFAPRFTGRNEARMYFGSSSGQARIDFFECGSQVPTRTEIISWF